MTQGLVDLVTRSVSFEVALFIIAERCHVIAWVQTPGNRTSFRFFRPRVIGREAADHSRANRAYLANNLEFAPRANTYRAPCTKKRNFKSNAAGRLLTVGTM